MKQRLLQKCSFCSPIRLAVFGPEAAARVKHWNDECRLTNDEWWNRFTQSFKLTEYIIDVGRSMLTVRLRWVRRSLVSFL
ncbi:hypothetical protein D1AOALGA4SA_7981 [Olavius algarvensis Delta 1 endosymbiont]|nr:hypothetical protein D1AOALGA4SA_7981 [Olavius algarvensis Delta 1 endosymbiont]